MKLSQMQYFCAAYANRSLTKAAQQLFVSQPAITIAIKELEEELHILLFIRKNNRIIPTEEGAIFYLQAQDILRQVETVRQKMISISEQETAIRLGIPYITAIYLIPELRRFERQFRQKHPEIHLEISEENPESIVVMLESKQLDLAIDVLKDPHFADFGGMMLCEHQFYLCVNKQHPLASKELITPDMLLGETMATNYSDKAYPNQEIKRWFHNAGCLPPRQIHLNQASTLLKLLSINEVVALLRREMLTIGNEIVCIPLKDPIRIQLSIHWCRQPHMQSKTVILLEGLSRFKFTAFGDSKTVNRSR